MASASGRSRLAGAFLALAASSWLAACAQDDVLPSHEVVATCGNGVTDANEECDVASPGCVNCQVQPEWTCTASGCTPLCVDGVVGSGPACNNPHRDTACDLSGFWAVREKSYLRDTVFGALQVSSQWYLYEISQTGDSFVIDASLDCAVHVTGSATIDFPPATKRGQIWLNPQDGTNTMWPKRSGTSMPVANGCAVSLEPWYFVWGATTAYVPTNFEGGVPIESLPPLPSVPNPINDNLFPLGATDPTTVGIPGFGTVISGILPGLRYSAQRSVTSFATTPGASVANAAMTLVMPGTFDVQENVLRVTECGSGCGLLTAQAVPATPVTRYVPTTTWTFIGKTLGSARVAPIVVAAPRVDVDLDLETCANVQMLLPHDGTSP